MNNTFAGNLKQMQDMILSQRGVLITYRQRGIAIVDVPAVPTKTDYVNEKNGERRSKYFEREYIIEFALLQWNGEQVKPKSGDNIIDGEVVYEVTDGEAKQCYCPVDSIEKYVRIFTKRTSKTMSALPPPEECRHVPMTDNEVKDIVTDAANRVFSQ